MALPEIRIKKEPLDGFSTYCVWKVTVIFPPPDGAPLPPQIPGNGFPDYQWAIDLPPDTDILSPEDAETLDGAPPYSLDGVGGHAATTSWGEGSVEISFVAACKERPGGGELSLERRTYHVLGGGGGGPDNPMVEAGPWERVPFKGAPDGKRRVPIVPAAFASASLPGAGRKNPVFVSALRSWGHREISFTAAKGAKPGRKR